MVIIEAPEFAVIGINAGIYAGGYLNRLAITLSGRTAFWVWNWLMRDETFYEFIRFRGISLFWATKEDGEWSWHTVCGFETM